MTTGTPEDRIAREPWLVKNDEVHLEDEVQGHPDHHFSRALRAGEIVAAHNATVASLRAALAERDAARVEVGEIKLVLESQDLRLHQFKAEKDAAEAALAEARTEIERCNNATRDMHQRWLDAKAEHAKSEAGWQAVNAKWREDYDTLSVRYTRACEALRKYGAHKFSCDRYEDDTDEAKCTCDFDKALASGGEGER